MLPTFSYVTDKDIDKITNQEDTFKCTKKRWNWISYVLRKRENYHILTALPRDTRGDGEVGQPKNHSRKPPRNNWDQLHGSFQGI